VVATVDRTVVEEDLTVSTWCVVVCVVRRKHQSSESAFENSAAVVAYLSSGRVEQAALLLAVDFVGFLKLYLRDITVRSSTYSMGPGNKPHLAWMYKIVNNINSSLTSRSLRKC
jgi:hypothetical protein